MSYTVLVIDDTKKIVDIVQYFLENEGYKVLSSLDPTEGLRIAKENKVDLLLLDIMMPGMDGYTVYDKLKNDPKTRDVPVIMLTAKAIILHTPKDFFYGLYGFLAKPFTKQQLVRMVSDILQLTKTAKEETRIIKSITDSREETS